MPDNSQKYLIDALRTKKNPVNPKLKPIELRARGYQLHVAESKAEGSQPMSYEEWIKTQDPQ